MEKNILLEIHRMNELMGIKRKPLIMEQGLFGAAVRMFIKKGLTFEQALDDAAELLVASGKMGQKEVDDAVRLLKNEKSLVDDVNKTYKNSKLSPTLNDDYRIAAKIDDLIKKSGSKNLDDFIKSVKIVTQNEVDFITSSVVKNMIKNNEFVEAAKTIANVWNLELKKILRETLANSKSKLNLSDFANAYETASKILTEGFVSKYKIELKARLDLGKISKVDYDKALLTIDKEVGEPVMQFLKDKHKYTNDSEIMSIIDEYRVAGRLDEGPGTISKPVYGKNNPADVIAEFTDDGSGKSFFRSSDDNLPINVDNNLPDVITDDIPPLNLDEWGPMVDNSGKLGTKWSDNFFFRYCKMGFCEAIIDFSRSLGRSPESFVMDTTDTLNKIDELFKKYSTMNPGDAGYVSLKKELDGYVNRLKSNAKMLQKGDVGFETTWKSIEANIRKTLTKDGDASYANEFINYIKNKAVTSGGETIGGFIDLMKAYYTKKSGSIELVNVFEMFTPEFWRNWKETKALKYAEDVKAIFNKDPKNGAIFGRIANTVGKVVWDIAWNGFKRAANFLTIGTFRYYGDILKRLKTGKFTDWKGLTNYGLLYIELVIITNVMDPIFEFIGDWYDSYQEINLISDVGSDPRTPFEKLKDNFASKINIFGNEFDWVPFYNPIPKTDGTYLGLKPAPLPNYLTDKLIGWVNSLIEPATTNTTGDVIENRKTKLLEQINPQIADLNKELQAEWDSATPKEKEEIKEKNGYYKDYYDILKFTYDDEIEPSYLKMILDSLEYNPKVSSDTVMKMVDMEKGDFSKVTEYTKLLKDSRTAIADVKGFMTIKDKGGRKYRIIMKPSNDELYYIEPSIDVLDKDPRTKIQQKNIKDFVNKLK